MFNGRRLRAFRKGRELTTTVFAVALGQSNSSIVLYETGHRTPSPEVAERMAAILGVPVSAFYDDPVAA